MANLSNINNKFLVTTGGNVLIGQTATVGSSIFQVTGSVNITGGTTSGLNITTSGTQDTININRAASNDNAITKYQTASADKWIVGLRNTSDDNFRFYSYGTSTDVLTIDQANGNVGIGTSSPATKLQVNGTTAIINSAAELWLGDSLSGGDGGFIKWNSGGDYLYIGNSYNSAYNTNIVIASTGNVGIGTTSPSQKLDTPNIVIGGSSIAANYRANSTMMDNLGGIARFYSLGPNTSTGGSYQFNSLSSNLTAGVGTVMTILNTGKVGIGTTSPNEKLQVAGNIHAYAPGGIDAGLFASTAAGSTTIAIRSSGVTHFNGGNVGIGTTSPQRPLHVNGTEGVARFTSTASGNNGFEVGIGTSSQAFLWQSEDSYIQFATNNVERMRITSSGQVGIGTPSPQDYDAESDDLVVAQGVNGTNPTPGITIACLANQAAAGRGALRFADGTSGNQRYRGAVEYQHSGDDMFFRTSGSIQLAIDSAGNVGIGSTDPSSPAGVARFLEIEGSTAGIVLHDNGNDPYEIWASGGNLVFRYNNTDGANGMLLSSTGNLGIGTTSPTARLDILTNSATGNNSIDRHVRFRADNGEERFDFFPGRSGNSSYLGMYDSSEVLKVYIATSGDSYFNGGNVGIGTSSPEAKLDISNVAGATYALEISTPERNRALFYYNSASTSDAGYLGIKQGSVDALNHRFATTGNSAVCIEEGNFGIGTDSPSYKLHVASSNNVSIFEDTSNASGAAFIVFNRPSVFSMGSITRNGSANSVSYNTGSDYRLKEDLKDFNALDLVNNITAYDYKWKDVEQRDYGFIAHELKQTLPNVVTGEKDGEKMQGVDYSKLTPILLKAIQELEARVKELENK